MSFGGDERGQAIQVGAIILFAVLVIALSLYQAEGVPAENEQVEVRHSEAVQGQLAELRAGVLATAGTGSARPVAVTLGTRYPGRVFFLNPPSATGRLRTADFATPNVTISNATATGEAGDYWDGSQVNLSTTSLTYTPNYHEYADPPETHYAHSVLYDVYDDAVLAESDQVLVVDHRLTVPTLAGDLDRSGLGTVSVDPTARSAPHQPLSVTPAGGNITLTLPTRRGVGFWQDLLADADRVAAVRAARGGDAVTVELVNGTYSLATARVGIGDVDGDGPSAHYAVPVGGNGTAVAENSSQQLVLEVRDRFNNPVTGATVNATLVDAPARLASNHSISAQGQTGPQLTDLTTDADGRVTVDYELDGFGGENADARVRVSLVDQPPHSSNATFDGGTLANFTFEVRAVNTDDSTGGSGPGSGPGTGNFAPNVTIDGVTDDSFCNGNSCNGGEQVSFDVTWSADDDSGLNEVYVRLIDSTDTVVHNVTVSASGTTASDTTPVNESTGYGQIYTIEVVARDDEGATSDPAREDHEADGDGTGSPP